MPTLGTEVRKESISIQPREKRSSTALTKEISVTETNVPLKRKEKINICIEQQLLSEECNQELMESDEMREIQGLCLAACKNAHVLPSVGEKKSQETYRHFFKRRHTVERTNLIIVRA